MRTEQLAQKFRDLFGPGPVRFFTAPGRVNLIGEHIDYCGGKVFPAALTLCSTVAARPNGTDTVRMAATDLPGVYCFDLNNVDAARGLKWGTYQAGMAKELISGGARLRGVDMLFDSTLPFGSGLSSSAAIEMSSGLALLSLSENYDEVASSINNIKLAQFGQRAENKFCGVNCGIMDQFASQQNY